MLPLIYLEKSQPDWKNNQKNNSNPPDTLRNPVKRWNLKQSLSGINAQFRLMVPNELPSHPKSP